MASQLGIWGCTVHFQPQICLTGRTETLHIERILFKWQNCSLAFSLPASFHRQTFVFPTWGLPGDEKMVVTDKAREVAHQLHLVDPNGTPKTHSAVPTAEPNWDSSERGMLLTEHYCKCVLAGLRKGGHQNKRVWFSKNKINPLWVFGKNILHL